MGLLGILEFYQLEFERGCCDFLTLPTLVEPLKHIELLFVHLENSDESDRLRKLQEDKIRYHTQSFCWLQVNSR